MATVYLVTASYEYKDFGGDSVRTDLVAVCLHPRRADEVRRSEEDKGRIWNSEHGDAPGEFIECNVVEMIIDGSS